MSSPPSPLTEDAPQLASAIAVDDSATLIEPAPETSATGAPQTSLYRVVWRWHFYAGLIVAPVMLIAAVTGGLYVFSAELSNWAYADLYQVEPQGTRLSYDEQRQRLQEQVPDMEELDALNVINDPRQSTRFITHAFPGGHENLDQMHRIYYVNPYTGKLLGSQIREQEFFSVVLELHRNLFAGITGRVLVELATSWGLVLLATGLFLWWPRNPRQRIYGVWLPRLRAKPYVVLRDLHSITGVYTLAFAAIVLATGLSISAVWGTAFTWVSVKANQSLGDFFAQADSAELAEGESPPPLETMATAALNRCLPGDGMYLSFSEIPGKAHKVYLMYDGDTNTVRGLDVDQKTGELVSVTETAELTPMVRALALAISLHQGKTFGLPSKIVAFLTCLVLVAAVITGVWMWWQRRPAGSTGFPQKPRSGAVPLWGWGLVVVTGLLLPTVGASILLMIVGEWLIRGAGRLFRPTATGAA